MLFLPKTNALTLLKSFFFKLSLSPFLFNPPTNQKIFDFSLKIPVVEEKLVDLESLIIFKFLFLKIICCLNLSPLKFLIDLNNTRFLSFNFFDISITNNKFSLFVSEKK